MFSSFEVVLKYIAGQLNPIQLTFIRFIIGFLFLFPLAFKGIEKKGPLPRWGKRSLHFALLGLIGISLSMPILHLAVAYTNSSQCGLVQL